MERLTRFGMMRGRISPCRDPDVLRLARDIHQNYIPQPYDTNRSKKFRDQYHEWICATKLNNISGLNGYSRYSVFGVTHAIEQFLMQHRNRRFMTAPGEYTGTVDLIKDAWLSYGMIGIDTLDSNDAIVISMPFAATGNCHIDMTAILDRATYLNIPVLLDCAFYGMCQNANIDLGQYPIHTIAFSVSKCFAMNDYRVGMIYTNDPPASVAMLNGNSYTNHNGEFLASKLFDNFDSDYIFSKYRSTQELICSEIADLKTSDTVLIGNGGISWDDFSRHGNNRVCFSTFIHRLYLDRKNA